MCSTCEVGRAGVTLVFTGDDSQPGKKGDAGTFNVNGGTVELNAPAKGDIYTDDDDFTGVLIWHNDPDAKSRETIKIVGNGDIVMDGAIYAPDADIHFGGTNNTGISGPRENACTLIIGYTVTLSGTPELGLSGCGLINADDPNVYFVRLVE